MLSTFQKTPTKKRKNHSILTKFALGNNETRSVEPDQNLKFPCPPIMNKQNEILKNDACSDSVFAEENLVLGNNDTASVVGSEAALKEFPSECNASVGSLNRENVSTENCHQTSTTSILKVLECGESENCNLLHTSTLDEKVAEKMKLLLTMGTYESNLNLIPHIMEDTSRNMTCDEMEREIAKLSSVITKHRGDAEVLCSASQVDSMHSELLKDIINRIELTVTSIHNKVAISSIHSFEK